MNILGIVNDPLPAGYRVEVSDEGSPMKSATSTAGASLSQLNSPTLSPREVTGWGRGGTDVASPDHWEDYGVHSLHNPPILFPKVFGLSPLLAADRFLLWGFVKVGTKVFSASVMAGLFISMCGYLLFVLLIFVGTLVYFLFCSRDRC